MVDWAYSAAMDPTDMAPIGDPRPLDVFGLADTLKFQKRAFQSTGYILAAEKTKEKLGHLVLSKGLTIFDREDSESESDDDAEVADEDWTGESDDEDEEEPEDGTEEEVWSAEPSELEEELEGLADWERATMGEAYVLWDQGRKTPGHDTYHQWALTENPAIFEAAGIKLFPHQRNEAGRMLAICRGIKSAKTGTLESLNGAIIAYHMGTGKTFIIITVIKYIVEEDPHILILIVVPLGLISMWKAELQKFLGTEVVLAYRPQDHGPMDPEAVAKYNVVLTNFETVRSEWSAFTTVHVARQDLVGGFHSTVLPPRKSYPLMVLLFAILFIDEAARISRGTSKTSRALCSVEARKRFAVTGTPIENDFSELQTLTKFLKIKPWDDKDLFDRFFTAKGRGKIRAKKLSARRNDILHTTMRAYVFSLGITDTFDGEPVVQFKPAKVEWINHDLTDEEMQAIDILNIEAYWDKDKKKAGFTVGRNRIFPRLLAGRMKCFHKACGIQVYGDQGNSDELDDGDMEDGPPPSLQVIRKRFIDSDKNPTSSRLEELLTRLEPLVDQDVGKVLVFDQFLQTLDLVANALDHRGIPYLRYDGWQTTAERDKAEKAFQDRRNPVKVMLITITTGGVSLNLTAARWVFILTMGWNPFADLQAEARPNRPGQEEEVTVYYFYSHHTIERRIKKLREKKVAKATGLLAHHGVSDSSKREMESWDYSIFDSKFVAIGLEARMGLKS
ncbi:hypothetical protein CC86DRAFT_420315 [Ophiobolus disseminans]|uniref:P-loop containing nucleoside triphosphate hydrolase protein n=1 Tax=Ophiobolus disseminans TaxID=1469910 RepID=A0A6A6ZVT2_9PLEO|nr:hypothetical protein CC86DRAFT_420315 [Ophiobolus disseminans]